MPVIDDVQDGEDFAEVIEEVKVGILAILQDELIPDTPQNGEKVPILKNRRIIDSVPEKYADKLRSPRHKVGTGDNEVNKVHAYMVGYGGLVTNPEERTVGSKGFILRFLIDSYYEDDIGTDSDNAEKRHAFEVARIAYALFASRVLRKPSIVHSVLDWNERRGFSRMGDVIVRESLAELFVRIKAVPLVKPS